MKKLFMMMLPLLILCSCSEKGSQVSDIRLSSDSVNLNLNGEFYIVNQNMLNRLCFMDFDTMTSAPVCARPNCLHDDPSVCTAIGIDNHPIVYDGTLYFFDDETVWTKNQRIVSNTIVYSANIDGSSRKKIGTIENIVLSSYSIIAISDSTVYFSGTEMGVKEDNSGCSGYNKHYMCNYDLVSGEFENYGLICEGYNSGAAIMGEYRGGLYISSSYTDEPLNDYMSDNWHELFRESVKTALRRFDIETKQLSSSDLPIPDFIGGGFYGYNDGEKAVVINADGKTVEYEGFRFSGAMGEPLINGFAFNLATETALNLVEEKIYQLNADAIPKYFTVIAYRDGNYIGYYYDEKSGGKEYARIAEDDIIAK